MALNNFLPFAPTDTGTNLLSQSDYAAAADRTNGNQPGVASAKLVNKALRQAAYISSQFAQFLANKTGADILDDATPAKLLAQIYASMDFRQPIVTDFTASGAFNRSYIFSIVSGNATAGATYTNNGVTYTVSKTIAAGLSVVMSGSGAPTVSGTLTKASGTGDSTLTFYAYRASLYVVIDGIGGGGGGAGSGNSGQGNGGNGSSTTIGSTLIVLPGGGGGLVTQAGTGGAAPTIGAGVLGFGFVGGGASGGAYQGNSGAPQAMGGVGGSGLFGGAGYSGGGANGVGTAGGDGAPNSGAGGGGAGGGTTSASSSGAGGGSGAGARGLIITADSAAFAATYAVVIGTGGGAGTAGSNGTPGGAGAAGRVRFTEYFQ